MLFSLLSGGLNFYSALIGVLAILIIIFLIIPFHEWAHAFTAHLLGDKSIKARGRLTLNPLSHIDPFGALALLLFGFGWGKPVSIDARKFKNPRIGMGVVALMGPVANILAALVGAIVVQALSLYWIGFHTTQLGAYVKIFLDFYVNINVNLAVFNLLPIPPLDGSKILFMILPAGIVKFFYDNQRPIAITLMALLWIGSAFPFLPFNFLQQFLGFLSQYVLSFIKWVASLPFSFS